MPSRRLLTAVAAASLGLAGGGCAADDGAIEQAELERQVRTSLSWAAKAPKSVRCPGDVAARPGATTRCLLVGADDAETDAAVRVTTTMHGRPRLAVRLGSRVPDPVVNGR